MPFIVNTMGQSVVYMPYKRVEEQGSLRLIPQEGIEIKGGQGVMRRRELFTPRDGVVTEVTPEQLAELENNCLFREHRDNGFLTVIGNDRDQKKAVADMTPEDDSAQLTPNDFAAEAANAEEMGEEFKLNDRKVRVADGAKVRRSRKRSK